MAHGGLPAVGCDVAPRRFGPWSASLLVFASMVGTGVFTTSGYLLRDLGSVPAVLLTWLIGGLVASAGALSYGELAAALPENGGEYHLLSRIYHPALGFCAAFVSFVVGFSAPTAAAAIAFGTYLSEALGVELPTELAACGLIVAASTLNFITVDASKWLQNTLTFAKAAAIGAFILGGLSVVGGATFTGSGGERPLGAALLSSDFAVGLIFVSFAYSGWNAAAYVAGEVERPEVNLPRALGLGTLAVTVLYMGLNAVFLLAVTPEELAASEDRAAHVAAVGLFGELGGRAVSGVIALGLLSTVGALVVTGPRVSEAVGRDYPRLAILAGRAKSRGPAVATVLQGALAILMAITASFDALVAFVGFTLSVFAGLTVLGVFVLRRRQPDLPRPYRTVLYPLTPALFLLLVGWMCAWSLYGRPLAGVFGAATIALGVGVYLWARRPP